jgi:sporulation protein YlmC with PRC-barrel domain
MVLLRRKRREFMAGEFLYWTDLIGRPVHVASQGRQAGTVEDFYFESETQSIHALRVKTTLYGRRVLLSSAIAAIDRSGVTIANENMLIDQSNAGHLSQLPLGSQLLGSQVVDEKGRDFGVVSNLVLGVYPPVALRVSSFEVGRRRGRRISAYAITHIKDGTLTILEQKGR